MTRDLLPPRTVSYLPQAVYDHIFAISSKACCSDKASTPPCATSPSYLSAPPAAPVRSYLGISTFARLLRPPPREAVVRLRCYGANAWRALRFEQTDLIISTCASAMRDLHSSIQEHFVPKMYNWLAKCLVQQLSRSLTMDCLRNQRI